MAGGPVPKKLERKLFREAKERGYGKDRTRRFVYGTMNKLGLLKKGGKGK